MSPRRDTGNWRIYRRLWGAFLLQVFLISATAVVGVLLAEFAIREILIVSALEREADYFWSRYSFDESLPTPNTHALIGYLFDTADPASIPDEYRPLGTGIHDVENELGSLVVHVSEANGKRLYLVFDATNARQLATWFGVAPLALMLVVLYSSAWLAWRLASRAVSPVVRLARQVREVDIESATAQLAGHFDDAGSDEVSALSQALRQLLDRVQRFVERERSFTRETSHELRSPLTVIRMAARALLADADLTASQRVNADRIDRAARDMEDLSTALLVLAREEAGGWDGAVTLLNPVVEAEIARCRLLYADKAIEIRQVEQARVNVRCNREILAVVVGNILRNACAYTPEGVVEVTVREAELEIADSGVGIAARDIESVFEPHFRGSNAREAGHGIGLSLVRRITERFGWDVNVLSLPGQGTRVRVRFPAGDPATTQSSRNLDALPTTASRPAG